PLLGCPIFGGCDKVLISPYSAVGGIPVALFGAVYYLTIFILGIAYFDTGRARVLKLAVSLTPLGLIASLWFLYLQLFVIKALCFYCLLSLVTSTLLFILGLLMRSRLGADRA
ncbi:MAG: vitamin K epoxide reductase family protein, partial [Patescibacteria group bacterium]